MAPLCALALFAVVLLRDASWGDLIAGPAVVLATSTAVVQRTDAAPAVAVGQSTPSASATPSSSAVSAAATTAAFAAWDDVPANIVAPADNGNVAALEPDDDPLSDDLLELIVSGL